VGGPSRFKRKSTANWIDVGQLRQFCSGGLTCRDYSLAVYCYFLASSSALIDIGADALGTDSAAMQPTVKAAVALTAGVLGDASGCFRL
jgi:hypothetical protein